MARQPYITYTPNRISDHFRDFKEIGKYIQTYVKFLKEVKALLEDSFNNEVHIVRERRGEWGEWFEYWSLINGTPKITKQGWN